MSKQETGFKDWNVKWQSGTSKGTVIVRQQRDAQSAYTAAGPALATISKEKNLTYLNVTIEER